MEWDVAAETAYQEACSLASKEKSQPETAHPARVAAGRGV
jgi:hypothetical protein